MKKFFCISKTAAIAAFWMMGLSALMAQTTNKADDIPRWYVGANVGAIRFEGDEATKDGVLTSLRLGYDYSPHWSFEGLLNYMPYLGRNETYDWDSGQPVPRPGLDGNSTMMLQGGANVLLHFVKIENRHWDPYLLAGLGLSYCFKDRQFRDKLEGLVFYGAGLAYHFNQEWAVRAELMGDMTMQKQEFNFMPSAGVTWKWGAHVPAKYRAAGGALDSDADGLTDADEAVWKTNPFDPDTDKDGLTDGEEVHKYETDPLNPDSDYDMLKDGDEVYLYKTLPKERDTDKGGVADGHEVLQDNTNPLDPSDDLILFTLHMEFDTDKAIIHKEYFRYLDIIGKVLARNPQSTATIEGHADKRKTSIHKYNMELSERRAKAVADYMRDNFKIAPGRMTSVGYGFTKPLAPNDPVTGNSQNRRVEFYILGLDQVEKERVKAEAAKMP